MPWITLQTPLGILYLEATDTALTGICFEDVTPPGGIEQPTGILEQAAIQLQEYFEGTRAGFDLPLQTGGTAFQQAVWNALCDIQYGHTATYGQLAKAIGYPLTAARGVGQACGRNPLPIIIPCHRALGKNGHLTGYGGGIWRKEWLLAYEQNHTPAP